MAETGEGEGEHETKCLREHFAHAEWFIGDIILVGGFMEVFLQDLGSQSYFPGPQVEEHFKRGRGCPIIKHCWCLQHLQNKIPSLSLSWFTGGAFGECWFLFQKSPGDCQWTVPEGVSFFPLDCNLGSEQTTLLQSQSPCKAGPNWTQTSRGQEFRGEFPRPSPNPQTERKSSFPFLGILRIWDSYLQDPACISQGEGRQRR